MATNREQTLIDAAFSLVLTATSDPLLCSMDNEHKAKWVAHNLKELGFPTQPIGMSWGMLIKNETDK